MLAAAALLALGLPSYAGGLMGVRAHATLDAPRGLAHLRLERLPFLGSLQGDARFAAGGGIELDAGMARALARYRVRVVDVRVDPKRDSFEVVLSLPVLGQRRVTMFLE